MNDSTKITEQNCPCCSGKLAADCCFPFIFEGLAAQSPEQLMRSRYTAFAVGEARYLIDSWHASTRPRCMDLDNSQKWTGLRVIKATSPIENNAYVEFVARYQRGGKSGQMHERSRFLKAAGHWFYVDGEVIDSATQVKLPGRNDPCYCASGKKFKKCCGK